MFHTHLADSLQEDGSAHALDTRGRDSRGDSRGLKRPAEPGKPWDGDHLVMDPQQNIIEQPQQWRMMEDDGGLNTLYTL